MKCMLATSNLYLYLDLYLYLHEKPAIKIFLLTKLVNYTFLGLMPSDLCQIFFFLANFFWKLQTQKQKRYSCQLFSKITIFLTALTWTARSIPLKNLISASKDTSFQCHPGTNSAGATSGSPAREGTRDEELTPQDLVLRTKYLD